LFEGGGKESGKKYRRLFKKTKEGGRATVVTPRLKGGIRLVLQSVRYRYTSVGKGSNLVIYEVGRENKGWSRGSNSSLQFWDRLAAPGGRELVFGPGFGVDS